jgi:hypothetical protein
MEEENVPKLPKLNTRSNFVGAKSPSGSETHFGSELIF